MFGFGPDASNLFIALHKANSIIEIDLDGKILSANPNFLKIAGYSRLWAIPKRNWSVASSPLRSARIS